MLERARRRLRRARLTDRALLVRGDIRALPFRRRAGFGCVMAPYGVLQSMTRERDLKAALASVAGVLRKGGLFALDLVPDLPRWAEYARRTSLRGPHARGTLTLIESVRQEPSRGLTIFDQEYVERRGGVRRSHHFELAFRTLSVPQMTRRLEKAGFVIDAVLGDYQGGPWDPRADTWVVLARKSNAASVPGSRVRRFDGCWFAGLQVRRVRCISDGPLLSPPTAEPETRSGENEPRGTRTRTCRTAARRTREPDGSARIQRSQAPVIACRASFYCNYWSFCHVRPFQSGTRSSTRRARPTPSAARFSRASSRN